MRQLFKFTFASCLGTLVALIGIPMLLAGIVSLVAKGGKEKIKPNSVITLKLEQVVPEKTNNLESSPEDIFKSDKILGLSDILATLQHAKTDDRIKGIMIEPGNLQMGMATMSSIRKAIEDFKTSGKFVYAYGNSLAQGNYYIASVADSVYVNPMGGMELHGFGAQVPFMKELLDRQGIRAQVFYAGKFKSATEPLRRTNMSDENRLQVKTYMNEFYEGFVKDIAKSRNIQPTDLKRIINDLELREGEDAVRLKLVDKLIYRDEYLAKIKNKLGIKPKDKISSVSLTAYHEAAQPKRDNKGTDKIAIVYAEGSIVDGEGGEGSIGGDRYGRIIRKIREDEKVKAIVLRVNSGGGSGLASEIIWREIVKAKEQGIKVVVSMGDVAASGGYYIACEGDKVFAEEKTITGSIGVFGVMFAAQDFFKNKIGITFDTVKTAQYATMGSLGFNLSEEEGKIVQQGVDTFYQHFLLRVANGRKLTTAQVDSIAQGRVWTGTQAKKIGLVDEIGSLQDAIKTAADLAQIDSYRTIDYPLTKTPMEQFVEQLTGKKEVSTDFLIRQQLGSDMYSYYRQLKEIQSMKGIQARMPEVIVTY